LDAHVVVADLTSKNPNVFYELGIAHAVGNKTIMTAQSDLDVPFDIASYRVLFYQQTESGLEVLRFSLGSSIREMLEALERASNPYQEAVAARAAGPVSKRTPLVKFFDFAALPEALSQFFRKKSCLFIEDLPSLDLEELIGIPGVRRFHLEYFVSILLSNQLYDVERLQDFILRHRLRTGVPLRRSFSWR